MNLATRLKDSGLENWIGNIRNTVFVNFNNSQEKAGPVRLLILQPTTFCNLNCDYCYLPDRHLKYKLSLDLLEPIFQKLFASPYLDRELTVVWHAGEPLTVPITFYEQAFEKIAQLNRDLNGDRCLISHSIQTNGTLINQAWCDLIKRHQIKLGVSVDGPDFLHDAHRKTRTGVGTHAGTMRGIKLLQENNINFNAIAVLTQNSLQYPNEIFHFFKDNDIKYVGFNIDEMEGEHQSSSFADKDAALQYRQFMQRLFDLSKDYNQPFGIREFDYADKFLRGPANATEGQFTPYNIISIDYQGNFTTYSPELLGMKSDVYGDFSLGNILQDSFESVWKTEKFQRMNRDVQNGVEKCKKTCKYFSVCGGGAPSNKYFENGSFNSAETIYCQYTKKIVTDIVMEDMEARLAIHN